MSEEDFGDSNPGGETNGHVLDDPEDANTSPEASSLNTNHTHNNSSESGAKKRRKSSAEKFLEDNSEYYGIQVLPNKLRSKITFHKSFLEFLKSGPRQSGNNGLGQQRHNFLSRQPRTTEVATSSLDRVGVGCGSEMGVIDTSDHLGSASLSCSSSFPLARVTGQTTLEGGGGSWDWANRGAEVQKNNQVLILHFCVHTLPRPRHAHSTNPG